MDISREWVSSLCCFSRPLLQLTSVCCLFVGLSVFSFVFSEWNAAHQVEIRELTRPLQNISLFYLQKLLGCFWCMFWVIVHLYYEALPNQFCCIWLNLDREYIPVHSEFIRLLLSSVLSRHHWTAVTQSHWKPRHAPASTLLHLFHRWCCMLWIMLFQASPYFFLPVILEQVDLNFSNPKNAFPE